jgi:hypothetical protein
VHLKWKINCPDSVITDVRRCKLDGKAWPRQQLPSLNHMIDRRRQLERLLTGLRHLVAVLRRDELCDWTKHFENCLAHAEYLFANGFTQEELNDLSSSIMRVYGGSGSFNDYPGNSTTTGVSGHSLSALCDAVYDDAQELRVIGRY